jgi:hypothetical protein
MAEKTKGFVEKGLSSDDKGVFIPVSERRAPRPEYLHMSKADVIKDKAVKAEKAAKLKAYSDSLDKPKAEAEPEVQEESKVKQVARKKK